MLGIGTIYFARLTEGVTWARGPFFTPLFIVGCKTGTA
jgi:hypothetical protein